MALPGQIPQETRDLDVIRAMYQENHGTMAERIAVIRKRCQDAGYPVNGPEEEEKRWLG